MRANVVAAFLLGALTLALLLMLTDGSICG